MASCPPFLSAPEPSAPSDPARPERYSHGDGESLGSLEARGIDLHSAEQHIGAHKASADGLLFDEARGAALLTMLRITDDDHAAVVVCGTHFYAASRCSVSTHLLASWAAGRAVSRITVPITLAHAGAAGRARGL